MMSVDSLPGPTGKQHQEHQVAQSEATKALLQQIDDQPGQIERLLKRHILSIRSLDASLLLQIFRLAARFELGELTDLHPARGRILNNLFFDQSRNHTRLSFNSAWLRLGGSLLNFERSISEITGNRHAPDEIAELCNNYGDVTVLRTLQANTLAEMIGLFQVPVINAGNGGDEHPVNGIADLYTLLKWRPELLDPAHSAPKLQIGLIGNPANTRTIRSFLYGLSHFPQLVERIVLIPRFDHPFTSGQLELLQKAGLRIELSAELYPTETLMETYRRVFPTMDLLYIHNLHPEQFNRMDFLEAIEHLKPDTLILSPQLPHQEVSNHFNDSPYNGYFAQARGMVFICMAILGSIIGWG